MTNYTHLEDYINDLYGLFAIADPHQLEVDHIARKLRLEVFYGSASLRFNNDIVIKESTKQREWQSFGHELCHFLRHIGSHLSMNRLFIDLQEDQANHFSYHFCVPTFMLNELKEVNAHEVMTLFNVEENFAFRRLEMYQSKVWSENINERSQVHG